MGLKPTQTKKVGQIQEEFLQKDQNIGMLFNVILNIKRNLSFLTIRMGTRTINQVHDKNKYLFLKRRHVSIG